MVASYCMIADYNIIAIIYAWFTCENVKNSLERHVVFVGAVAITSGFTNGVGQIWLDEVRCSGTELSLAECPANPLGQHNCVHENDAGVRCQGMYQVLEGIK